MNSTSGQVIPLGVRLVLLVPLFFCFGCTPQSTPPKVGVRSVACDFNATPLLAECAQWEDGCAMILITTIDGTSMRGADWRPTLALWVGELSSHDGRKFAWDCQSSDGRTGKITVDHVNYDLATGSVLLVTVKDDSVIVKQVKRETLSMAPDKQTVDTLLKDSEVATFFREPEKVSP